MRLWENCSASLLLSLSKSRLMIFLNQNLNLMILKGCSIFARIPVPIYSVRIGCLFFLECIFKKPIVLGKKQQDKILPFRYQILGNAIL